MRIGVVGAGYVGLVTGVCLAEMGNHVHIVDIDEKKIAALKQGQSPHYEPGLSELLTSNIRGGRLTFSTCTADAAREQDAIFLAVGTPMSDSGAADLSFINASAMETIKNITQRTVIIVKSTVPVGTNAALLKLLTPLATREFSLISNPEFLKEGAAIDDFMRPDRIVIGARDDWAMNLMRQIYAPFVRNNHPLMMMDPESAEMVKYASNTLLACKISFINEIAGICLRVGADVELVRRGIAADTRLGGAYLYAGLGYGGSCFPKDVRALVNVAEQINFPVPLCSAIDQINVRQQLALLPFIDQHFPADLTGKKFAVWGLAFKPHTDDVREAPALRLIRELIKRGATIAAYDPQATANARRELPAGVEFLSDAYSGLTGADALIICTEWNEFRTPNFAEIKKSLRRPLLFDGRNLYDLSAIRDHGFTYYSIGRPAVVHSQN